MKSDTTTLSLSLKNLGVPFTTEGCYGRYDVIKNYDDPRGLGNRIIRVNGHTAELIQAMADKVKQAERPLCIYYNEGALQRGDKGPIDIIGIGFQIDEGISEKNYMVELDGSLSALEPPGWKEVRSSLSKVTPDEFHKSFEYYIKRGNGKEELESQPSREALRHLKSKEH